MTTETILVTPPLGSSAIGRLQASFGPLSTIRTRVSDELEHATWKLFIAARGEVAERIVRKNARECGIALYNV